MQATWITALMLLAAAPGAAGAEGARVTPDQAVLACMSRVGREMERRDLGHARPIGRFETVRMEEGWRVHGLYLAQRGSGTERLRITCEVTPGLVDVATTALTE